MPNHTVRREKLDPEPFGTPARIRAAVARAGRAYAMACDYLPAVIGEHTAAAEALRLRVDALRTATDSKLRGRAQRLHDLTVWIAAVAEAIEIESGEAADLRPCLAAIMAECERIASARFLVAAA